MAARNKYRAGLCSFNIFASLEEPSPAACGTIHLKHVLLHEESLSYPYGQ
jgi:hypothetical protein